MKTMTTKKSRRRGGEIGWILRRNSGNNAYHSRGELRFAGKRASRRRNYRKNWKSGTRCACCVESTPSREVPIHYTIVRGKRRVWWLIPAGGKG
jgi:hypothetical protein